MGVSALIETASSGQSDGQSPHPSHLLLSMTAFASSPSPVMVIASLKHQFGQSPHPLHFSGSTELHGLISRLTLSHVTICGRVLPMISFAAEMLFSIR